MKTIKLQKITVQGIEQYTGDVYSQLLDTTLPKDQKFLTVSEIRKRAKVQMLLEEAANDGQEAIAVEDAEWETLKNVIENTEFRIGGMGILALIDNVLNAV